MAGVVRGEINKEITEKYEALSKVYGIRYKVYIWRTASHLLMKEKLQDISGLAEKPFGKAITMGKQGPCTMNTSTF